MRASILLSALSAALVAAQTNTSTFVPTVWNVTVGHNTTTNGSLVFQPERITAAIGDTVVFNFTLGNHTVTQSDFGTPCIALHTTNVTLNGFDSGFRNAGVNGTGAITTLTVPIVNNQTIWFFDYNTCAIGGVGAINSNESSTATLAGFIRNAERINGTHTTTSNSNSTNNNSSSGSTGSDSGSSDAPRTLAFGAATILPLIIAALCI